MHVGVEQIGSPIDLRPWFEPQRRSLLAFLERLENGDWLRPTACEGWNVADLLAHVVGDVLGRISGLRDRFPGESPNAHESLEQYVDRINEEWVVAHRRLSPALIVELLSWAGDLHDEHWRRRALEEPSLGVSWAGMDAAPVWFDAAREVTEYWVHERQLREAVGEPGEGVPGVAVVLDVFARGLPYTLGRADLGGLGRVRLTIDSGEPSWLLENRGGDWSLVADAGAVDVEVSFDSDLLWRQWTRQPTTPRLDAWEPDHPVERVILDRVGVVHSSPVP
jgi:uncharacterized protein (TIGR03083 family)